MKHKNYSGGVYRICKSFTFSAAHRLWKMPDGHKCKRQHGHNYTVHVVLESEHLNETDMVCDFGDLSTFKKWLDTIYDHRDLNEVLHGIHPTAENLAKHFFDHIKDKYPVTRVRVYESDNCWAEYEDNKNER